MGHDVEILPECVQIFRRLEEKLDDLKICDTRRNGKYDNHINEAKEYRAMTIRHDEILKDIVNLKRWWLTAAFSIIGALLTMAVIWGNYSSKVDRLVRLTEGRQGIQSVSGKDVK